MNKSILTNPAWYRDNEGRTGFKSSDFNETTGKQSSEIKNLDKKVSHLSEKEN